MEPFVERRKTPVLTEEQIEEIAERAAERAVAKMTDHMYREIGKTVFQKFVWILGVVAVGLSLYAANKGWIKP